MIYFSQVALIKVSITLLYLRIFGRSPIRSLILATIFANIVYGVIFIILSAVQCQPIRYFWNRWHGEMDGVCLDVNGIAWANAGVGIALDLWILALPLSQIKALNMHYKKKIGIALMFSVGIL
jgi:hypothetical protein